jgi:transposase
LETLTFVAALRIDRIEAPWLLDGPINGRSFQAYVREELTATLKPGDIVVLDNLGSHKGKAIRQMIHQAGAKLFFLADPSRITCLRLFSIDASRSGRGDVRSATGRRLP